MANASERLAASRLFVPLEMLSEFDTADQQLAGFLTQADELRARIASQAHFATFSERRRKHILKGETALLLSQDELLQRMGENVATFRGMYRFLSFHVHSLPVAFYRMADRNQGRGIESEWEKDNIALSIVLTLRLN